MNDASMGYQWARARAQKETIVDTDFLTPAHHLAVFVLRAVRAAAGPHNLAPLAGVRYFLAGNGLNRVEQDAAIHEARRLGMVTATAYERDVSAAQRMAAIAEDGRFIGYLSVKE